MYENERNTILAGGGGRGRNFNKPIIKVHMPQGFIREGEMLKLQIDRCIKSYYFLISSITLNSIWSSLSSIALYCLIANL